MANDKNYDWKNLYEILHPKMQFAINQHDNQIRVLRYLAEKNRRYLLVWQKTYNKKAVVDFKGTAQAIEDARLENKFLLAISSYEVRVLKSLAEKGLRYCSLPFRIEERDTNLRTTIVEIEDAGPSLDYWQVMGCFLQTKPLPDFFANPISFLRLTRGVLQALSEFHQAGYVHLDLSWANICMSLTEPMTAHNLTSVTVKPNWDGIKLIDFAYTVSNNIFPPVCFIHGGEGHTNRFNNVKDDIGAWVREEFKKKENNCNTISWQDALVDPAWWSLQHRGRQLRQFSDNLDWREDIYALGIMLLELTERTNISKHSRDKVNELVASLPASFISQGLSESLPHLLPHQDWIKQIDAVLALCPDDMRATDAFHLVSTGNSEFGRRFEREASFDPQPDSQPKPPPPPRWQPVLRNLREFVQSLATVLRNNPLLVLLALSYLAFVFLAITMGNDPIGLPLGGTAALSMLIVLGLVAWKLAGLLTRIATRCLKALGGLLARLGLGLRVRWWRWWHNAIALRDKLPGLIQNAWVGLRNNLILALLAISYLAFVCLLIARNQNPIGGTTALVMLIVPLTMLIVLGRVVWKLAGLLTRGAARGFTAFGVLLRRLVYGLRIFFTSRYLYPILLVPLAWGAETQYGLVAKAEKTYTDWQIQRYVESTRQIQRYVESTRQIQHSNWFQSETPVAANSTELAWTVKTRKLAAQGVPYAQLQYAILRCFRMDHGDKPRFQVSSTADCGGWLGAALGNGLRDWEAGVPVDLPAMAEEVYLLLRDTAYREPPVAGSDALLRALAPALPAIAPHHAKLAFLWADIQACRLDDAASARRTLREIVTGQPGTEEAKQAAGYLPGLKGFCTGTEAKSGGLHSNATN